MPIEVRDLLDLPGLGLAVTAGESGLGNSIRWVHTSELSDPTPWLSGGELLLTTGLGVGETDSAQQAYIKRLVAAGVSGLGFGVGFTYDSVPPALLKEAEGEGFPILEVPYPVPFIAIAEAVSSHLTEDRLRDAQMSVEVHERLASLVSEGAGLADVLDEMNELAGGWAVLFDLSGKVVARSEKQPEGGRDLVRVWRSLPPGIVQKGGGDSASSMSPEGTQVAFSVRGGRHSEGVLVFGKPGRLTQRDRIIVHHAVTVLGLLLTSRRAVIDAERRVAGDILSDAFAGRLGGADLERRLALIGFGPGEYATAMVLDAPASLDSEELDDLAWSADAALGGRARVVRTTVIGRRVAALVVAQDPESLAAELTAELSAGGQFSWNGSGLRVGVGEPVEVRDIRQSYLSAVFALRASPRERAVASPRDLGSYGLLLGGQPRAVLEGFVRSVLGPLIERDRTRSSELVESVRAYVEAGGRWEAGAEALGIHRHTLRYRVRQAEELIERDLTDAEDRMEVWLALKAAEIIAQ
jgi:purine catabolism regulator